MKSAVSPNSANLSQTKASIELSELQSKHRPKKQRLGLVVWVIFLLATVISALAIRASLVEAVGIPSSSMFPTLRIGDQALLFKAAYSLKMPGSNRPLVNFDSPKRGDVVVFESTTPELDSTMIKRIVGIPGDIVQVRNYFVFVNGFLLPGEGELRASTDKTVKIAAKGDSAAVKLGADEYYVMGDNRRNSIDSREFGPIRSEQILGRAVILYWSRDPNDNKIRFDRLGTIIK